jgi:type VI protein secretion system component Hcp
VLGNEHFSYSLYADKLASQLEQCGVAYYNQTANDLDYIDVYKYALLLAEGDRIKNKLKEALKHSNNEKKAEGVDVISDKLKAYVERHQKSKFTGNIDAAEKLLKECIPILKIIKTNRGGEDELYINLSSAVVSQVFNTIVEVENQDIESVNQAYKKLESEISQRNRYNSMIERQNRY